LIIRDEYPGLNHRAAVTLLGIALFVSWIGSVSAEIIPVARRTDWTLAGVPGGIPDTSGWAILNVTNYGADPTGLTDSTIAIQNCLNAARTNRIYFPAGTYRTTNSISAVRKTLELFGDGPTVSKIVNSNITSAAAIFYLGSSLSFALSSVPLTGGLSKDSTTVTASNATGFTVGDLVLIDQLNDTNGVYTGYPVSIVGAQSTATWVSRNNGTRAEGQMAVVTGISGNNISFTPPLTTAMYTNLAPQICKQNSAATTKYIGIKNLYLENAGGNGFVNTTHDIEMNFVAYFWITNCTFNKSQNGFIYLRHCLFGQVSQNWLHHSIINIQNRSYGVELGEQTTRVLIFDNIIGPDVRSPFHAEWGASGNVFAYNYCSAIKTNAASPGTTVPDYSGNHGAHPRMNLFEGNVGNAFRSDFLMGTSSHCTVFRNYLFGAVPAFRNGVGCIDLERGQTFYNVVGNVLGNTNISHTYEAVWPGAAAFNVPYIRTLGYSTPGYSTNNGSTDAASTLLWHGNSDSAHGAVIWDNSISDRIIPNSMYLASKPSWWNNSPWPPIGPDISGRVNSIPAQMRFESLISSRPRPPVLHLPIE
jgi:hypothetical protein